MSRVLPVVKAEDWGQYDAFADDWKPICSCPDDTKDKICRHGACVDPASLGWLRRSLWHLAGARLGLTESHVYGGRSRAERDRLTRTCEDVVSLYEDVHAHGWDLAAAKPDSETGRRLRAVSEAVAAPLRVEQDRVGGFCDEWGAWSRAAGFDALLAYVLELHLEAGLRMRGRRGRTYRPTAVRRKWRVMGSGVNAVFDRQMLRAFNTTCVPKPSHRLYRDLFDREWREFERRMDDDFVGTHSRVDLVLRPETVVLVCQLTGKAVPEGISSKSGAVIVRTSTMIERSQPRDEKNIGLSDTSSFESVTRDEVAEEKSAAQADYRRNNCFVRRPSQVSDETLEDFLAYFASLVAI